MVDFFTVPPVFVSVYLNRSWLGKDVREQAGSFGLGFKSLRCHRVDLMGLTAVSECTNLSKSLKLQNWYLVVIYMG